ncbi:TonB-dependent receptor [Desulfomonile tiedjei]|uniref:Uncharacterized protein n=1 Tax=Desulfomonile tiedjei (strain ATCC 49306 / DSM 6799 / DCB-1) TaxID=706587 RepID=I4C0B7_DESTA|nr:TonB-dependent receptor [Desulfomonile tiedjei]AFM23008.1 hypothetical protein Desti_0266 [Desulfomonile tiedjei DSM 6799]
MDFRTRSKQFVCLMAILFVCAFSASAHAQGLFGAGLPGLPSFGFPGGIGGCGERACPAGGLVGYIGWMENREGTEISGDTTETTIFAAFSAKHKYPERGLWLGLIGSGCLSEQVSLLASGWYLVPSRQNEVEIYDWGSSRRNWDTDLQWWYVDGLFAFGKQLSLLAGLRFDRYSNKFKNPSNAIAVVSNPNDTADVNSDGWIPLVGTQYVYADTTTNLTVRAVGFPVLLGNFKYREAVGGANALEGSGNWRGGYFLEIFGEYSKRLGPGTIGVFGRWNGTEGKTHVDIQALPLAGSSDFDISFRRITWTVGGSVGLSF